LLLALYSLALTLVLLAGAPFWLFRMATSGKYREGLGARLGRVPARLRQAVQGKAVIWVHAVSVGEVLAASRLIEELRQQSGCVVVVSTTTRTGQKLARERFGADTVFYFPLDFAFAVRAYLKALQPRLLVLLETEFWPRLLVECRRKGIPVAVVNARISDRSWPRYRRLRFLWKRLLSGFAAVLAQSELDAERLRALAAARVQVTGNLKYDIRITEPAAIAATLRQQLPAGAPVLVCGSTCESGMESEEQEILGALPQGVMTILAPRHPERFAAVAKVLERSGRRWHRRSEWGERPEPLAPGSVLLLDSIGELASVYALATVAFVGGSLTPTGGHNPLEPAQFGVPVVMGPHYQNFRGVVEALRDENAIRIVASEGLAAALAEALTDPEATRAMGERARAVFERESGATERAVKALLAVLRGPA
jgi:3-deoxy-D-manno-octulosonic-acid transferase